VIGYLVAEELLEAVQVRGEALRETVAEFGRDRRVAGPRWPGREKPGEPGALIRSPARIGLYLPSR
jgi:hypothetical protein